MKVIRSGITPEMRALCSADLNMEHERVVLTSKLARAPLEITKPSMVVVFEKGITAAISIPAGARVAAVCVVNIAPHGRVELVVEGRVERVSLRSAGERAETSLRVEAEGEVSEGRVAIGHDDASIRIEGAGAFDCAAFKDADGLPERAFACSRAR